MSKFFNNIAFLQSFLANKNEISYNETIIIVLIVFITVLFCLASFFVIVALYLRLKNYFKAQNRNQLEAKWKEEILEILAEEEQPRELTEQIKEHNRLFFLDYLFRFALRIKGQELTILSEIASPFTNMLLERIKTGDKTQKVRALITLDKLQIHSIEDDLYYQLLKDSSPLVSLYTARSMVKVGKRKYMSMIIQTLPKYENWSYRVLSNILAEAGPAHTDLLRKALLNKNLPVKSRTIIGHTLLILHDIKAADLAVKVLQKERQSKLIPKCLEIIANTGAPGHRIVVKAYTESEDPEIRAKAIKALGVVGQPEDVPLIEKLFIKDSNWVSLYAARALKNLKADNVLQKFSTQSGSKAEIAKFVLQS